MLRTFLIVAVPILDVIAVVKAIVRGHGVEGTIAWILAIIAFPGFGAVAYLALASPSVRRTRLRRRDVAARVRGDRNSAGDPAAAAEPLFELARRLTGIEAKAGNRVQELAENRAAFARMDEALDCAQSRIWAEYYMVRDDATGRTFLDILTRAAARGVEVRFIHDAVGSSGLDHTRLDALAAAGGRIAAFHPVNPLAHRWSLHLRNHRKLIIVDDAVAFTGGMNVGDEYSGRAPLGLRRTFRDTQLELQGPAVADLSRSFIEDWAFATDEVLDDPSAIESSSGDAAVAILPSGPDQKLNATEFMIFSLIGRARHRLWITSPYFIPDLPMQRALQAAALRGVDVRILVPEKSDVRLARAAARSFYGALLETGVRIYEYRPRMLHAKTLVVDSRLALIGSANCDFRSFRLNFELGALIDSEGFARELERRFDSDVAESIEVLSLQVRGRSLALRFGYGCVRLFSPLL